MVFGVPKWAVFCVFFMFFLCFFMFFMFFYVFYVFFYVFLCFFYVFFYVFFIFSFFCFFLWICIPQLPSNVVSHSCHQILYPAMPLLNVVTGIKKMIFEGGGGDKKMNFGGFIHPCRYDYFGCIPCHGKKYQDRKKLTLSISEAYYF